MTQSATNQITVRWGSACFLLEPLGWVADRVGPLVEHDPRRLRQLITIDKRWMHLIGLTLAHMREHVTRDVGAFLLENRQQEILATLFGHQPPGLDRALDRLPDRVLTANRYRQLVDLLNDRPIAKFFHHATAIDDAMIIGLHKLPVGLRRPAIIKMVGQTPGLTMFVEGLQFLATHARVPFESLVTDIAAQTQLGQIAAKIRSVIDELPLPDRLPPAQIETFRRIDRPPALRALAKAWQNCLADCVYSVNEGTYAVYFSDQMNAACLVCRYGRLGWFLSECKGPKNTDLDRAGLNQVQATFTKVGILPTATCEAIRAILLRRAMDRTEPDAQPDYGFALV